MLRALLVEVPRQKGGNHLFGIGARHEERPIGHRPGWRIVYENSRAPGTASHNEHIPILEKVMLAGCVCRNLHYIGPGNLLCFVIHVAETENAGVSLRVVLGTRGATFPEP